MKKNLLVLMAIFCSLPLFAEFNLGVKGGYTSTLSFSNLGDAQWSYVDPRNAQGFHVGAFARFGNIIYFQPEVLYNREITKGTKMYADKILENLEEVLQNSLITMKDTIEQNLKNMQENIGGTLGNVQNNFEKTVEDVVKTVQENRKELK